MIWPLLRILDGRFADTNRRLDATRLSLHQESNLTRDVVEQHAMQLERAVAEYTTVNSETLTFMATQMRHLQHEVETMAEQLAELRTRLDEAVPSLRD
jgi:archaellum component FlaC